MSNPAEQRLISYLDSQTDALTELLERLVNTDSFSIDKAGVDAAGEVIREFLKGHGIEVEVATNDTYGNALVASIGSNALPVVMMGHRDTVFPPGEAQRRSFKVTDGRATGPGINDMKAGVAINAMVLSAFKSCYDTAPAIKALFTGDEELASPFSRPIIEELARGAKAVFNSEPARVNGNVVIARKGGRFMLLEVWGKPAHSGVNFFDGISAVNELAAKISALSNVTDQQNGTTLNVGLIRGGQTVNTVAPYAAAEIDLRFVNPETSAIAMRRIDEIVAQAYVEGTSARLTINGEFLPMMESPPSRVLFELYRKAATDLGVKLDGEFTGSCADSGFASAQGVATLCGTGAVGNGSHTPQEYIEIDTLLERAKVLAVSICRVLNRYPDAAVTAK